MQRQAKNVHEEAMNRDVLASAGAAIERVSIFFKMFGTELYSSCRRRLTARKPHFKTYRCHHTVRHEYSGGYRERPSVRLERCDYSVTCYLRAESSKPVTCVLMCPRHDVELEEVE